VRLTRRATFWAAAGLALPATDLSQQLFSACVARGGKARDDSGLVTAIEALAECEIS